MPSNFEFFDGSCGADRNCSLRLEYRAYEEPCLFVNTTTRIRTVFLSGHIVSNVRFLPKKSGPGLDLLTDKVRNCGPGRDLVAQQLEFTHFANSLTIKYIQVCFSFAP